MKDKRCSAVSSRQVDPGPNFCHAHELTMPCGLVKVSNAQEPPITVACRLVCPVVPDRPKRLEFMW